MPRFYKDEGIVLKKKNLLNDDKLITIFSKNHGKTVLFAKGIRKIISRRLSHLETGNLIKFSFYEKDNYLYLRETEIIYGYSKIKRSDKKINILYLLFFILNKILPENQKEPLIFDKTLEVLRDLNNKDDFNIRRAKLYLSEVLVAHGFINKHKANELTFDPILFVEELIHQRIKPIGI